MLLSIKETFSRSATLVTTHHLTSPNAASRVPTLRFKALLERKYQTTGHNLVANALESSPNSGGMNMKRLAEERKSRDSCEDVKQSREKHCETIFAKRNAPKKGSVANRRKRLD